MTTITTRSGKGSALTHQELDDNFSNLNTDKLETSGNVTQTGNVAVTGQISAATITATGNITGNYFIGNGSQLTGISGGNATPGGTANSIQYNNGGVFGGITDSFHYTANGITEISKVRFSSTSAGGGSGEVVVPGTAGYVSVVGNVMAGNVSVTGNVDMGNINITGRIYDTSGVFQIDSVGNIVLVPTGSTQITGAVSATGNVTAANIVSTGGIFATGGASLTGTIYSATALSTGGAISAVGNITGAYLFGNGSQLTGISGGGGGTPAGSDSQIQFNDGGAFGGNAAMTFNDTNGDIILGNVAINGQRILPGNTGNLDLTLVTGNANPWQLRIGNSFNGNTNWAYNIFQPGFNYGTGPGFRVHQSDVMNMSNANIRFGGMVTQNYLNLTANITNNNSRYQGINSTTAIIGGASGNTHLGTNVFNLNGISSTFTVGNVNANLAAGNTSVNYVSAYTSTIQVGAGSNVGNAIGAAMTFSYATGTGNIGNLVGYTSYSQTGPANANIVQSTSVASFFHPGASATILPSANMGNIARMATNYHAFRNDDNLAKAKMGMIDSFHELNANTTTTTGSVTISKADGQVQTIYPTGNVTIAGFSNFVPRVLRPNNSYVNTTDTVTVLIQQGATPYTVTMPTGNTQIRYASGISTVPSTANTTVMISITGTYNYSTAADQYLITISPEFT